VETKAWECLHPNVCNPIYLNHFLSYVNLFRCRPHHYFDHHNTWSTKHACNPIVHQHQPMLTMTRGNPVPVVPVTQVRVVGLVSDQGVTPVTAHNSHTTGQASKPGKIGNRVWTDKIYWRKEVHVELYHIEHTCRMSGYEDIVSKVLVSTPHIGGDIPWFGYTVIRFSWHLQSGKIEKSLLSEYK
jgi:hypothetical protein